MARKAKKLAPVELMLMEQVWARGSATVHEVRDGLAGKRDLAYTTVLTTLRNLEKKGFLKHEERDRRYVYVPLVSAEEASSRMLRDFLHGVFGGSRELLLTKLFELGELDERELELLRQTLTESKRTGPPSEEKP